MFAKGQICKRSGLRRVGVFPPKRRFLHRCPKSHFAAHKPFEVITSLARGDCDPLDRIHGFWSSRGWEPFGPCRRQELRFSCISMEKRRAAFHRHPPGSVQRPPSRFGLKTLRHLVVAEREMLVLPPAGRSDPGALLLRASALHRHMCLCKSRNWQANGIDSSN